MPSARAEAGRLFSPPRQRTRDVDGSQAKSSCDAGGAIVFTFTLGGYPFDWINSAARFRTNAPFKRVPMANGSSLRYLATEHGGSYV
jgi:hypothetical protein